MLVPNHAFKEFGISYLNVRILNKSTFLKVKNFNFVSVKNVRMYLSILKNGKENS